MLRRTLEDYLFFFGEPKPDPVPVTRYGLATLAIKWAKKEIEKTMKSSAPDKQEYIDQFTRNGELISRDAIDDFLKPFFKKQGQRLSAKALSLRILPHVW